MRKFQFLSSFILKIAAILFMTLDHVGLMLHIALPYKQDVVMVANTMRSFGRLALPLFVFMIVEGVIHTKNIKKYFLRLGILAFFISLFLAIITYVDFGVSTAGLANEGNIFLDLLLIAFTVYLLKQDNKWLKLLTLLPIAISFASFFSKCYEFASGNDVLWYPNWLYLQYDWFSVVLGVLFYLSYKLFDLYKGYVQTKDGIDPAVWEANGNYRLGVSLIQVFMLALVSVAYYCFKYIWPSAVFWDANTQLLAIISGAFVLLYNGTRGYNAKWFQYGAYLYYPLHLVVIMLIYILCF